MTNRIDTITGRKNLLARTEPYWYKLSMGQYLGFRKLLDGSGRWIARKTENRRNSYESLKCDELTSFSDAQKLARQYFDRAKNVINLRYNVQDAINDYADHLEIENSSRSAREAKQRLAKHVSFILSNTTLSSLSSVQIRNFRNKMVKKLEGDDFETKEQIRKSKDSANRVMNMLKAALNMAYRNDYVNSDAAWRKVTNFRNVTRSRDIFFTDEQVNNLLRATPDQFQKLLMVALNTGARYGELRFAKVSDFNPKQKTLRLSGKTGTRLAFLSDQTVAILNQITKLRHPTAFLLVKDGGESWGEKDHARRFKDAAIESGLPVGAVFYCLRHYYISKALLAGVSPQVIAENCGTSIKMIEKHYGKFMDEDRRIMLNQVKIANIPINIDFNVPVPLKK